MEPVRLLQEVQSSLLSGESLQAYNELLNTQQERKNALTATLNAKKHHETLVKHNQNIFPLVEKYITFHLLCYRDYL
jgi:hypothetical protein